MPERNHLVEVKARPSKKPQFGGDDIFEYILRFELQIVLDENKQRMAYYQEGDFYLQNAEYVRGEIMRRLAVQHKLYPDSEQVKQYLERLSHIIETMVHNGRDFNALPYTPKNYQKKAAQKAEAKDAQIMKLNTKPMGRPRKTEPKRQHKRRYLHPSGTVYESIAEAARQEGESYGALKKHAWRTMQRVKKTLGSNGDNSL